MHWTHYLLNFFLFFSTIELGSLQTHANPLLRVLSPQSGKRLLSDEVVVIVSIQNAVISKDLRFCIDQIDAQNKIICWENYGSGDNGIFTASLVPAGSTFYSFFKVYLVDKSGKHHAETSFYITHLKFEQCIPLDEPRNVHLAIAFNQGLDLLEMIFLESQDKVKSIALVETSRTPSGDPKPLQYQENKSRFKDFWPKIHHRAITTFPLLSTPQGKQRVWWDSLVPALQHAKGDDVVVLITGEEIPSSEALLRLQSCSELVFPTVLLMDWYLYNLNWHAPDPWGMKLQQGPVAVTVDALRKRTPYALRHFLNATEISKELAEQAQLPGSFDSFSSPSHKKPGVPVSVMAGGGWHFQNFKDEAALSQDDEIFQATGLAGWELPTLTSIDDKYFQYMEHSSPAGMPRAISYDIDRFAYLLPNINGFETEHKETLEFWILQAAIKEQRTGAPSSERMESETDDEVLTLALDCSLSERDQNFEKDSLFEKYGHLLAQQFWEALTKECHNIKVSKPAKKRPSIQLHRMTPLSANDEQDDDKVAKVEFVLPSTWTIEVEVGGIVLYYQMNLKAPFLPASVQRFCDAISLGPHDCANFEKQAHDIYKQRMFYMPAERQDLLREKLEEELLASFEPTQSLPVITDQDGNRPLSEFHIAKPMPADAGQTHFPADRSLDHASKDDQEMEAAGISDLFMTFHKADAPEVEDYELSDDEIPGEDNKGSGVADEKKDESIPFVEADVGYQPYNAYVQIGDGESGVWIFPWNKTESVALQLCDNCRDSFKTEASCLEEASAEVEKKQIDLYHLEAKDFLRRIPSNDFADLWGLSDAALRIFHQLAQRTDAQTVCQFGLGQGQAMLAWLVFSEQTEVVLFDPWPTMEVLDLLQERHPGRLIPMAGGFVSSIQAYSNMFSSRKCNILLINTETTSFQTQQMQFGETFQQSLQEITNTSFHEVLALLTVPTDTELTLVEEHDRVPGTYSKISHDDFLPIKKKERNRSSSMHYPGGKLKDAQESANEKQRAKDTFGLLTGRWKSFTK